MEYRVLPHGGEKISTIGLGLGNIHVASDAQIEETVRYALDRGVNLFDLCCGRVGAFEAFGRAVKGCRKEIYTQMHFGAVYPQDTYGFGRDLALVQSSFEKVLRAADLGYTDFGYIHCIDEEDDFLDVMRGGIWDYVCRLKEQGIVRHLGFSSHTPSIARRFLETGMVDMFMFSINAAYDYVKGEYAYGEVKERMELYQLTEKLGVGITVMKPFAGGQLLDEQQSPLNIALTHSQCIQYCLDRPAVISCLPGVGSAADVERALAYYDASPEDRDYSILGTATPSEARGRCVYCNHCAPCPMGIDIGLANKYFDLAKVGDQMAAGHYHNLSIHADACVQCGHCESRCPFGVRQMARMKEIKHYFEED